MIALIINITLSSCKKFIKIEPPKNSLVPATVFQSGDLATAAVLGIYQQMAASGFASGNNLSISTICGLTADEFVGYGNTHPLFYENQVVPENGTIAAIWAAMYKRVYDANAILEGLQSSAQILTPVKEQLQGEAYFTRAFTYFYLVNLFGPVPLHLTTDYKLNSKAERISESEVYEQIINDLQAAASLLNDSYITTERIRPNKATVQALLSRTYYYLADWANAEKYASMVIDKPDIYKLVQLNDVFLKNSMETIWQLMPAAGGNTSAGAFLVLTAVPTQVSLRKDFVTNGFQANDLRKTSWIKTFVSGNTDYYYPFKYKVRSSTTVTEYFTVFRLAELYLIRAEARTQQNNLNDAIDDLDKIKSRAGLALLKNTNPGIDKASLISEILKERQLELFTEWGDRWFELKRRGISTSVLAPIKPGWNEKYVLFPIPTTEISRNQNITQNKNY